MEKTTTVVPFRQVDSVDDPLTEIAREGARRMLAVAMGVEADAFVAQHSGVALPDGRQDRKSVVEGKRVDLGGRRFIKKKKNGNSCSARALYAQHFPPTTLHRRAAP